MSAGSCCGCSGGWCWDEGQGCWASWGSPWSTWIFGTKPNRCTSVFRSLVFGMDVYIQKVDKRGTIISAWWRLLGGGRITIPILYMGVDIHVNIFFHRLFQRCIGQSVDFFLIGNCAIYCSNVVSCWCFTCLEPVTQLRWVMEVQMENCWKNAVHYRVIEYCQPRTTPSKIINMPPEKGPFQKDISSSKYPIFSRNFRFATKNAAVKKPPAKPDSSPRTRWSPRMKFPWPWPPRRSNGDVNALPKIKCRLLRQVRFWGGQWWVARRGGKDGSQARDSL